VIREYKRRQNAEILLKNQSDIMSSLNINLLSLTADWEFYKNLFKRVTVPVLPDKHKL
jgi:hypothetical protein